MGAVRAKAMFGGHGLYLDGVMFALLAQARLFVKADEVSQAVFDAEGCAPFSFMSKGRWVTLSYREAPPEALDQPEAAQHWGCLGLAAARRAASRQGVAKARRDAAGVGAAVGPPPDQLRMPNLGPRSVAMLREVGIHTEAQLRELGAVRAYARVKARCRGLSLNLLWALEGGLTGRHWQVVAQEDRASLLMALEDALRPAPPAGTTE